MYDIKIISTHVIYYYSNTWSKGTSKNVLGSIYMDGGSTPKLEIVGVLFILSQDRVKWSLSLCLMFMIVSLSCTNKRITRSNKKFLTSLKKSSLHLFQVFFYDSNDIDSVLWMLFCYILDQCFKVWPETKVICEVNKNRESISHEKKDWPQISHFPNISVCIKWSIRTINVTSRL